jgi:hypothetical protein
MIAILLSKPRGFEKLPLFLIAQAKLMSKGFSFEPGLPTLEPSPAENLEIGRRFAMDLGASAIRGSGMNGQDGQKDGQDEGAEQRSGDCVFAADFG